MADKQYVSPLSPEQVEGPYYSTGGAVRSDIRDGQDGVTLALSITVIDGTTGKPLPGSDVDLWQCNATGHYSGYDADPDELPEDISNGQKASNDETFLRGKQRTDDDGQVTFKTLYPGWYVLRTPHIHLKVFTDGRCNITTQLYLPEQLNQQVYTGNAYARSVAQDTHNQTDPVIGKYGGDSPSAWIDLEESAGGYRGTATIFVDPEDDRDPIYIPPGRVPPLGGFEHNKRVR